LPCDADHLPDTTRRRTGRTIGAVYRAGEPDGKPGVAAGSHITEGNRLIAPDTSLPSQRAPSEERLSGSPARLPHFLYLATCSRLDKKTLTIKYTQIAHTY